MYIIRWGIYIYGGYEKKLEIIFNSLNGFKINCIFKKNVESFLCSFMVKYKYVFFFKY